ncbi:TIR domain-containing protein [candidate division KSB1 bacterium]|nr:TIR domain-containing protein [candidate division KSB1 bacterium]
MHKIFLSYSHKDEAWKDRLVTQHGVLQMQDLLEIWEDRQIATGDDWLPAIEIALSTCNIAILLISANFLTSQFILGKEVPRLLELRQSEGVRVIPLIIKPCAWQKVAWLKPIQARPKDGRALSGGNDHQIDIDLAALANELAELLQPMPHAPSPTRFIPLPPEKIFTAKLPTTTDTLFGREDDLKRLDAAWADPNTHVLTLVAWGGVGKTALSACMRGRSIARARVKTAKFPATSLSRMPSNGLAIPIPTPARRGTKARVWRH